MGRLAKVVVVDLRTGGTLVHTTRGMGGWRDDLTDLYEELEPTFLGFDDGHAYWTNPTGHGERWRWDLSTRKAEPDGRYTVGQGRPRRPNGGCPATCPRVTARRSGR
jgi:hypothetical protein